MSNSIASVKNYTVSLDPFTPSLNNVILTAKTFILTLTRSIGVPPYTPVAQKIAYQHWRENNGLTGP